MSQSSPSALPEELKNKAVDYVAAGVKAGLGIIPFAGSFLAEIAGSIIPHQRMDRLADFTVKLEERIKEIESSKITNQFSDEEFTDLVEESLRQASRATTEERRQYLANLLANSITSEAIEHNESKHLLRILGELNDIEIIWLRFYSNPTFGEDSEFRKLHKKVLRPISAELGTSIIEMDDRTLQESYKSHLDRLGLTENSIKTESDGSPIFDKFKGDFRRISTRTTNLGDLLLRSIGLLKSD